MSKVSVHWFRHGLRLHDNPSLLHALEKDYKVLPIFINDGESAGLKVASYNRVKYLCDALEDLDVQFQKAGTQLYIFEGDCCDVLKAIHDKIKFDLLTFEMDCEAVWNVRDNNVKDLCKRLDVEIVEKVSHTLWNPFEIIQENGGIPPLTYEMFLQASTVLGEPPRPVMAPDFEKYPCYVLEEQHCIDLKVYPKTPTPEDLGYHKTIENPLYDGGETIALLHLKERLKVEKRGFRIGITLPNQALPDIVGPPMSMSAALRFGCLSVRKFYWDVQEVFSRVYQKNDGPSHDLTAQLIWREFFYCMSASNPKFDQMTDNPICIDIPWYTNESHLKAWTEGKTGYPFIDASMRQLRTEGWIHHTCRTATACFLTRGDLWISWEDGFKVFVKYLIDADWSVCAGNWMWISSSAFQRVLDCSACINPVSYGKRVDASGDYIRQHVPELVNMPQQYIFEPWLAPLSVQEEAGCVVGKDYPARIVDHDRVSVRNCKMMHEVRRKHNKSMPHCCPSNNYETYVFLNLTEPCSHEIPDQV